MAAPEPRANDGDKSPADDGTTETSLDDALAALDLPGAPMPRLSGPDAGVLYHTPRFPTAGPDEIRIRLIRKDDRMVVHITAPDPELADSIVRQLFGPDQEFIIEMCG